MFECLYGFLDFWYFDGVLFIYTILEITLCTEAIQVFGTIVFPAHIVTLFPLMSNTIHKLLMSDNSRLLQAWLTLDKALKDTSTAESVVSNFYTSQ